MNNIVKNMEIPKLTNDEFRQSLYNAQAAACYEFVLYLHTICPNDFGWDEHGLLKLYSDLLRISSEQITNNIMDALRNFLALDSTNVTVKQRIKTEFLFVRMLDKKLAFETKVGDYKGRYIVAEDRYEFE